MSRLSTTNTSAASGMIVPYALLVDFDFPSGHVLLTSWSSDIVWGGNTYKSLGRLVNVPEIAETSDLVPQAIQYTLSSQGSALPPLSTALTEKYHNRTAKLYVGWLDPDNLPALRDTPYLLHEGLMDRMPLEADKNASTVYLSVESRLILWNKAAGWMYTDDHQRQLEPTGTDNFFNLVNSLANKVVKWGEKTVGSGSMGGGGQPSPPGHFDSL